MCLNLLCNLSLNYDEGIFIRKMVLEILPLYTFVIEIKYKGKRCVGAMAGGNERRGSIPPPLSLRGGFKFNHFLRHFCLRRPFLVYRRLFDEPFD